jgi:uncharacterized protein
MLQSRKPGETFPMWEIAAAVLAGVVVAAIGTPTGVSGAVFLLPVQISVLGVMGPAVSATSLVFNAVSTPIALFRLARRIRWDWRGLRLVVAAGAPAAIVGATARVTVLADPYRFRLLIARILLPLGARLLWRARPGYQHRRASRHPEQTRASAPSSCFRSLLSRRRLAAFSESAEVLCLPLRW